VLHVHILALRVSGAQALVLRVFDEYIKLMRKVQTTYW
jgi:hypothetical protein